MLCEVLAPGCFDGLDLVIVDVDDPIAAEWAPVAAAAGAKVIDNSAAFRMDPDVPLVVAEVNPEDLRDLPKGIASCPNCTTMVLVTALAPLHRAAGIERMVVSTYQSVSGAGVRGIEELEGQWAKLDGATEQLRRAATVDGLIVPGQVWSEADRGQRDPARRLGEGGGLHVRGVEARLREPQDPAQRHDAGHCDLRAGPGVRRARDERERRVPYADVKGAGSRVARRTRPVSCSWTTATVRRLRSRVLASTQFWLAACERTRRSRTRSTSG